MERHGQKDDFLPEAKSSAREFGEAMHSSTLSVHQAKMSLRKKEKQAWMTCPIGHSHTVRFDAAALAEDEILVARGCHPRSLPEVLK